MIDDKVKHNTAMDCVSYIIPFSIFFALSFLKISHLNLQFERNDAISLKQNEALLFFHIS